MASQQLHCRVQLGLGNGIRPGQDNGGSGLHLIVVEFTEVLGIDLHLSGIGHGHSIAQSHIGACDLIHSADHIGQLTHAGGLNNDPVGVVLVDHLGQSLAEVAHQGAADAAGVHLRDVDACLLQEAAINANLTELIFDEHQLLALVALCNHLFDESGLTCTQETTVNINLCHKQYTFHSMIPPSGISNRVIHILRKYSTVC